MRLKQLIKKLEKIEGNPLVIGASLDGSETIRNLNVCSLELLIESDKENATDVLELQTDNVYMKRVRIL